MDKWKFKLAILKLRCLRKTWRKLRQRLRSRSILRPGVGLYPRRVAALELDLRGRRADEVEYALDAYLNDASMANLLQVRIIHGVANRRRSPNCEVLSYQTPSGAIFFPGEERRGRRGRDGSETVIK